MKLHYLSAALAAATILGSATAAPTRPTLDAESNHAAPLRWAPKAKAQKLFGQPGASTKRMMQEAKLSHLPASDECGYLDGPSGRTWFYTVNYDKQEIDNGTYVDVRYTGYHYTVYDETFNEIGHIDDTCSPAENETAIRTIQIAPYVTKKFFNYDDKYEFMVTIVVNTPQYVNNIYTRAYTTGSQEPIATFKGYPVSGVDAAADAWSENFYITFLTEEEAEQSEIGGIINAGDYVFTTYKKSGYSGMGDPVSIDRVPMLLVSGAEGAPFLAMAEDGKFYRAISHLKYSFFENPYDWENENATADNEFIIDLKKSDYLGMTEVCTTTIPATQGPNGEWVFYYLGNFDYEDDIAFGVYDDTEDPSFIITADLYDMASDGYLHSYAVYNKEGEKQLTLGEGIDAAIFQSDVYGFDPQVMFIKSEGDSYRFDFVNTLTGEQEASLPYVLPLGMFANSTADRLTDGEGGYHYVMSQLTADADEEDNTIHQIAYVRPDGSVAKIDRLNLGQNVAYADCHILADDLNPFIFNTDSAREYMVLVKRLLNNSGSATREELLIINDRSEVLMNLLPDEEMGELRLIWLDKGTEGGDALFVTYYNVDESKYTAVRYDLPLNTMQGEGTTENPYVIESVGDLAQIKNHLSSNYVLVADIDGMMSPIPSIKGTFTGSLDGQGHRIKGLMIEGNGMFELIQSIGAGEEAGVSSMAGVRNLVLDTPVVAAGNDRAGFIVGDMIGGHISDITVYNGNLSGPAYAAGGIAGSMSLYATIEKCYVNADIVAPEGSVGGIVGQTYTSSTVRACAFKGNITGGEEVGGMVGFLQNADDHVVNCHVNGSITGSNVVGGIVGKSNRGVVEYNHFSGPLYATTAPRWGGSAVIGGIVGSLTPNYNDKSNATPVVRGNYANIYSMEGFEPAGEPESPFSFNTMHRIVGFSSSNEPEVDSKGNLKDYVTPDYGLRDNYALDTMSPIDPGTAAESTNVEGASVSADALNGEFFEGIGYSFGENVASPWSVDATVAPRLWFESSMLVAEPTEFIVDRGATATITFRLLGEDAIDMDDFSYGVSDESILDVLDVEIANNAVNIVIAAYKGGEAVVSVTTGGQYAESKVTVNIPTSNLVNSLVGQGNLTITDGILTAEGQTIEVYNLQGIRVAFGKGVVNTNSLAKGVYLARTATRTLKFRR